MDKQRIVEVVASARRFWEDVDLVSANEEEAVCLLTLHVMECTLALLPQKAAVDPNADLYDMGRASGWNDSLAVAKVEILGGLRAFLESTREKE
jgi:hypothetical protein